MVRARYRLATSDSPAADRTDLRLSVPPGEHSTGFGMHQLPRVIETTREIRLNEIERIAVIEIPGASVS